MKPNYPLLISDAPPGVLRALQQIRTILSGGGTIADNQFAAIVVYPFTHGEKVERPSPLRGGSVPIGFDPIRCYDGNSVEMKEPVVRYDPTVGDGKFGLTVFARPEIEGEYVSSSVASGSAVALVSNVAKNVTSIPLKAGDWDVSTIGAHVGAPTGFGYFGAGWNTTSATFPPAGQFSITSAPASAGGDSGVSAPPRSLQLTAPATVYLVAQAGFAGGTASAYGSIAARRVGVDPATSGWILGILWGG